MRRKYVYIYIDRPNNLTVTTLNMRLMPMVKAHFPVIHFIHNATHLLHKIRPRKVFELNKRFSSEWYSADK